MKNCGVKYEYKNLGELSNAKLDKDFINNLTQIHLFKILKLLKSS
jgi:hypothetical protein